MADNRKFVQAQTFTLAGSGSALGATSITLSSFAQIDGTLLTITNFGTKGYATIEPNNSSKEEAISFTGVTQNANGTATLTGVSTQLFIDPYTETSGTTKLHAGGTRLILTNTAGFYSQFTNKEDDETINGLWQFAQFPQKTGSTTPTAANELASKAYVDAVVGGISVTDQLLTTGTAGESVTIAKIGYLNSSDGRWYMADSSVAAKSVGVKLGVFQSTTTVGLSVNVLTGGIDKNQSALTAGTSYYLSTVGDISTTKGANIRLVGRAQSTTTLQFEDGEQSPEVLMTDGSRTYATAGGTGGTYTLTLNPAISAYKAGQTFSFLAGTTSLAGTVTLNVNGLGAKTITKLGSNLSIGSIRGSMIAVVQYDGTNFELMSPSTETGTMQMTGSSTAPSGWLLCDASAVSRTTYADLFNVIGTTYGAGDASTTFNVPDMRGRVPVGVGTGIGGGASGTGLPLAGTTLGVIARGTWKGEDNHVLTTAEIPAHAHAIPTFGNSAPGTGGRVGSLGDASQGTGTTSTDGGTGGTHNNTQPVMGVNFIIKT